MQTNKKNTLTFGFFDGHPQKYHIAAVLLAVVALGVAVTTSIFAEGGLTAVATPTAVSCEYDYSAWGTCQPNGTHARTVTSTSPSGCVQTSAPTLTENCTYTAPACTYSYSVWGTCQSNGKHTRTVTGTSPSGCAQTPAPALSESCNYTPPAVATVSGTSACSYSYSSWGTCQPNGTHARTVTSTSPSGCVQTSAPTLTENCTYTAPATACSYNYSSWGACQSEGKHYRTVTGTSPSGCVQTTSPTTTESCTYTAAASMTAIQCAYTYSGWEACQSNGQQTRTLLSKSPVDCAENTAPILRQSCTYTGSSNSSNSNFSSAAVQCAYTYSGWGACQSNGRQTRSLLSALPTGCAQRVYPILDQSCTYSGGSNTSVSNPGATAIQCAYAYSDWGACQENGKRVRGVTSKSPSGCMEDIPAVVEQSCVYDGETETSSANTSSSAAAANESISSVMPTFSFTNIGEGMTIRGDFEIKGEVKGAQGVEYYLVPVGSNTYKYIGTATQVQGTEAGWRLLFHSIEFPNGEFYLRAKIKNAYGEYGSGQRRIFIANGNQALVVVSVSPEGFTTLGANEEEKKKVLDEFKKDIQLETSTTTAGGTENLDQERKRILDHCQEKPEKCNPERDSDHDGLSDLDEIRYGTDPNNADTDLDGFIDGDEVKNGFDPLKYSGGDQSDKMVFEDPKSIGEVKKDTYAVKNVELKEKLAGGKKLHLTGKGLPNSFVTVYIYSDPIVLTVKTDNDGNWTYELDKDLENGEHQVYVAVTDNTGKITAKSEPLAFVKTAEAATVIPTANAAQTGPNTSAQSLIKSRTQKDIFFLIAIIIAALAVAMATIGFIRHKHVAASDSDTLP